MKNLSFLFLILSVNFSVFCQEDTLVLIQKKVYKQRVVSFYEPSNDSISRFFIAKNYSGVAHKKVFEDYLGLGYGIEIMPEEHFYNYEKGVLLKSYSIYYDENSKIRQKKFSHFPNDTVVTIYFDYLDENIVREIDTTYISLTKNPKIRLTKSYVYSENQEKEFNEINQMNGELHGLQVIRKNIIEDSILYTYEEKTVFKEGRLVDILSENTIYFDETGKKVSKRIYFKKLKRNRDFTHYLKQHDLRYENSLVLKKQYTLCFIKCYSCVNCLCDEKGYDILDENVKKWTEKKVKKVRNKM